VSYRGLVEGDELAVGVGLVLEAAQERLPRLLLRCLPSVPKRDRGNPAAPPRPAD
jgi:hypothetical protein